MRMDFVLNWDKPEPVTRFRCDVFLQWFLRFDFVFHAIAFAFDEYGFSMME